MRLNREIQLDELPEVLTAAEVVAYLRGIFGRNAVYDLLNSQRIRNRRHGQKFLLPRLPCGTSSSAATKTPVPGPHGKETIVGYLKQLGEKKWRIVYDATPSDGRRRRQKTETLFPVTRAQAKLILAKREEAVAIGKFVVNDVTVSTLFERFIQAKTVAQRAPKTIERYGTLYAAYIGPRFGEIALNKLKQHHLTDAYASWLSKGKGGRALSARFVRHIHDLLRTMLNYALRKGWSITTSRRSSRRIFLERKSPSQLRSPRSS